MKLLINREFCIPASSNREVLKKFSIWHTIEEDGIRVEVQKVVLDEIDMNELFDECLYSVGDLIRYWNLGGAGCEFSIGIS